MSEPRTAPLIGDRTVRVAGLVLVASLLVYILIPVTVTLVMSFSGDQQLRFPIRSWSLSWYIDFASSEQWTGALRNSLIVASGTMLLSTVCGMGAAWAFTQHRLPAASLIYLLIVLPLFMPGVVLGLGVAMTFSRIEVMGYSLFGSHILIILAHSLWAMPLVFLLMEAVFRTFDRRQLEAALDLGARPTRAFLEVVLQAVITGVVSSALFAFVISLNEFVMALFLTDRDSQTLPVLMWLSLRSAATPGLAVAAVVLSLPVLIVLGLVLVYRLSRGAPLAASR